MSGRSGYIHVTNPAGQGPAGETGPAGTNAAEYVVTSHVYVDFARSAESYVANGSPALPYKTLAAAITAANTLVATQNPVFIVLISSNTVAENVTLTKGHVYLVGDNSSGTHAPILFTGSITMAATSGTISDNHFAISGLELVGVSGTDVLTFSGTYPQRAYLRDTWITANGTSHGITVTNTGTGSVFHMNDCKFSHNGSGDYHCINVTKGAANLDAIETSGSTVGVISVSGGGSLNISNSDIQSAGTYCAEVYASSSMTLANTKITTTAANSTGILLEQAGSATIAGLITFNVPAAGTGRAIDGVAGSVLYYGPMYFLPDGVGGTTNQKVNPLITALPINTTMVRA